MSYSANVYPPNKEQMDTQNERLAEIVRAIGEISKPVYKVWGVDIDQSNSNPSTCCTYVGDAADMTAGSTDWDDIFGCKPCLFVNGTNVGYLNKSNYAQFEDGSAADITTLGNDVMVEFPKRGYKITTSGTTVQIRLTNDPNKDGYCYKPFSRNAEGDRPKFYYGAYKSYSIGNKLYSSSGKAPTASKTRATYRTEARNRGDGYAQNGFYQLTYLQILYILKYKNLNSQAALGYGYVGGSAAQTTGGANTLGFNYGNTSSQTDRLKFLGIEDFWGNIWSWVDGLTTDASWNIVATHTPPNFDDAATGTNHTVTASGFSANAGGWMKQAQGGTDTGFCLKATGASDSTYYCDNASLSASCVAAFGGHWNDTAYAGAFRLDVNNGASNAGSGIASRLMYV